MSGRQPAWCHSCGDHVEQLGDDGLCPLCQEIEARLEARVGAAMEDYATQAIGVALDYLHPDDVRGIVERVIAERGRDWTDVPRLKERHERAHRYIDLRAERAARPMDG